LGKIACSASNFLVRFRVKQHFFAVFTKRTMIFDFSAKNGVQKLEVLQAIYCKLRNMAGTVCSASIKCESLELARAPIPRFRAGIGLF